MKQGHDGRYRLAAGYRGRATIPALTALAALTLIVSWPGVARAAPIGSASSATIQVRLSVAPRMQLLAMNDSKAPGAGTYCIGSNAGRPALPVYLIRPAIQPSGSRPGDRVQAPAARTEIAWCSSGPAISRDQTREQDAGLALIYPE